jgi:hypothetical protein
MEYYTGLIRTLKENEIFVFGSNPQGRHGAGAAKIAKDNYGAIYGKGRGIQGNSYALVTKNLTPGYIEKNTGIMYPISGAKSVLEYQIIENIKELYDYAILHPKNKLFIAYTNNGYNLNGYSSSKLFEMFYVACNGNFPINIIFNDSFKELHEELKKKKINFKIILINVTDSLLLTNKNNYVYCGKNTALNNPYENLENTKENLNKYKEYIEKELTKIEKRNQLNEIWIKGKKYEKVYLGCDCSLINCHCEIIKEIIINKQIELNKVK